MLGTVLRGLNKSCAKIVGIEPAGTRVPGAWLAKGDGVAGMAHRRLKPVQPPGNSAPCSGRRPRTKESLFLSPVSSVEQAVSEEGGSP